MEHDLVTPWGAKSNKSVFQINLSSTLGHTVFSKATHLPSTCGLGWLALER